MPTSTEVKLGFHPELTKPNVTIANPTKPPPTATKHASQLTAAPTSKTAGNTTMTPHAAMAARSHLQVRHRHTAILRPCCCKKP